LQIREAVERELDSELRVRAQLRPPWPTESEVGAPGTDLDGVRFRKVIVRSILQLRQIADSAGFVDVKFPPGRDRLAVEQYLRELRERTAGDSQDYDAYLNYYQTSRHMGHYISASEFRKFSEVWDRIVSKLQVD